MQKALGIACKALWLMQLLVPNAHSHRTHGRSHYRNHINQTVNRMNLERWFVHAKADTNGVENESEAYQLAVHTINFIYAEHSLQKWITLNRGLWLSTRRVTTNAQSTTNALG